MTNEPTTTPPTTIDHHQYLELIGLFTLADKHARALDDIRLAAAELLGAPRYANDAAAKHIRDHISDEIYGATTPSPEAVLKRRAMHVVVTNDAPPEDSNHAR